MNNWLKIGMPILIAVLLVTASVGITLAVTRADNVNTPAVSPGNTGGTQYGAGPGYAYGPRFVGCPAWGGNNAQGNTATGGNWAGCHGNWQ